MLNLKSNIDESKKIFFFIILGLSVVHDRSSHDQWFGPDSLPILLFMDYKNNNHDFKLKKFQLKIYN